ncbi:MAG: hypothetical protein K8F35_07160 [Dokdonella sp.]|uniref:WD40/YVTN/BNR-like repeat-containing protein n=1 Tax=Dokdonella sp. TaxID=2291710 RepID=UPI0025C21A79|nr:hypothetical protein [Dokdonella sp.]MBZ0222791.1 hypothetical protein [Dokdonella sp.]
MKTRLFACALVTCLLPAGLVLAGGGVWTSEGPYGGRINRLLVNPAMPSILYASANGGIFRSNDGGVSWSRKEAGLAGSAAFNFDTLALDAGAPSTLWTFDSFGRLNRTTDGAENWAQTGYSMPANDRVMDIVDAPGPTGLLYLATAANGVLASANSGVSFIASSTGLPNSVPINTLAFDPVNPLRMAAGVGYPYTAGDPLHPASIYLSTNGGASWSDALTLGGATPFYSQVTSISFGASGTVYAAVGGELYRSDDGGANWGGPYPGGDYLESVKADPGNAMTVLLGGYNGLRRSTDGGATSTPLNSGLVLTVGAPAEVVRIAVHPNYPITPLLWLGTMDAGVYFSANNGSTWIAQNEGLASANIRALAMFHDASTHRLFAGLGDAFSPSPALYRGNNGGPGTPFVSWANSNTNLGAYQIRIITIDPTTKGSGIGSTRIYAGGRSGVGYAGPLDVRNGGVYRSLDGGNTWTTIDSGLPTSGSPAAANVGTVRTIVLDPRSCSAPPPSGPCSSGPLQTVYATSNGRAVMGTTAFRIIKSSNGGDTWTSSDIGIPQPILGTPPLYNDHQSLLVVPLVVDPLNPQVLYAGTSASYDASSVPVPTLQSGVFKSSDGGATWAFRSNGLPRKPGSIDTALDVLSLAINPANPQELWCSVVDLTSLGSISGGIYHSVDGGANWSNASTGLTSIDIRAITIDATNPAVLYAAGGGTAGNPGGVYKTSNSGATWQSISVGLPADAALALEVDPVDSNVLYAGTSSGVWSLTQVPDIDGDGVPDAVENAAPNGGDGDGDGIDDAQQADVGSLTSATQTGAATPSGNPYFTVSITPVSGNCTQAVDVQSVYAAYHGNDVGAFGGNYAYPRQLARFEILDCQKATVKLKFHGASFGSGFSMRYFGPSIPGSPESIGWYDFSSRATQIAADTWQLTLENGQFGSYRPASANGILFEGGPAWSEAIFRDGFD